MEERMKQQLARRRREGTLRTLLPTHELVVKEQSSSIDFSSNDYLGLAQSPRQRELVNDMYLEWEKERRQVLLGATGSRLLSGDSLACRRLEEFLAKVHQSEGALVCNSGYDANLSVLSSLLMEGDVVIMDELVHNSLVMGVRMSRLQNSTSVLKFRHNNVDNLRGVLQQVLPTTRQQILIVVESVYSMDGDVAPLAEILDLAQRYDAKVMVDEAHGLGMFGKTNVVDMELYETKQRVPQNSLVGGGTGILAAMGLTRHPSLLCTVFTFGKAAGCHGAVVCGSRTFLDYLINYARPFVYSTALPTHSLVSIECAYKTMVSENGDLLRSRVFELVELFRREMLSGLRCNKTNNENVPVVSLWPSPSPIQALVLPGNDTCTEFCQRVKEKSGIILYPIRRPTVPRGEERVRIILHAHNTPDEVHQLVQLLVHTLKEMNLLEPVKCKL